MGSAPIDQTKAVRFSRSADGGVDLGYTLVGAEGDLYNITILVSTNGGKKFSPFVGTISGDVGDSITPGEKAARIESTEGLPIDDPSQLMVMFYPKPQRLAGPLPGMMLMTMQDGEFTMGSDTDGQNEKPSRRVTIERYRIMHTEVTQAQWTAVMGSNPSWTKGDDLPVESVSWLEASVFAEKLTRANPGRRFRLPTEAEWEFACRAGTTTSYYSGETEADLDRIAWYRPNSNQSIQPVGSKEPNAWGLYDMSGNVWEWCMDVYHDNYNGAPADGSAWSEPLTDMRVLRGGAFTDDKLSCRSGYRGRFIVTGKKTHHGFRLVEDLTWPPPPVYRKMR